MWSLEYFDFMRNPLTGYTSDWKLPISSEIASSFKRAGGGGNRELDVNTLPGVDMKQHGLFSSYLAFYLPLHHTPTSSIMTSATVMRGRTMGPVRESAWSVEASLPKVSASQS